MNTLLTGLRPVARLVVPGGLLAGLLLAIPAVPVVAILTRFTPLLLAVSVVAAVAMGWRFGRGHLIYGAALVVLSAGIPLLPPGLRPLGAALVSVNLALLALLPDRGILSPAGLARGAAIGLQVLLLDWLTGTGAPAVMPVLTVPVLSVPGPGALSLLEGTATLALATLAVLGLRRSDGLIHGLFWAALVLQAAPHLPVSSPALWPVVAAVVVLLAGAVEDAHRLAYHDGLTGLASRRALDERLPRMVGRYTVAMVDVDHFKAFNDRHGHDVGDQVLRMVATRLRETPGARAYRYGGEEFALVFRGRSLQRAREELESLRQRIGDRPFVVRGADRPARKPRRPLRVLRERQTLTVTVSVGAAERSGWRQRHEEVLKEADRALYRAKEQGRNRVVA